MTKEELKKEAKTECFMLTVNTIGIDQRDVELAYVMGAEPREKRIAELEYQLTHRNCLDCSNHSSKLRMRNLDLEKENAELKLKLEALEGQTPWKDIKDKSEVIGKLTKAKELLKQLVDIEYAINIPKEKIISLRVKAEQFLKDSKQEE